jgi:hypothetical protein
MEGTFAPRWFTLLVIAGLIGAVEILTNSQTSYCRRDGGWPGTRCHHGAGVRRDRRDSSRVLRSATVLVTGFSLAVACVIFVGVPDCGWLLDHRRGRPGTRRPRRRRGGPDRRIGQRRHPPGPGRRRRVHPTAVHRLPAPDLGLGNPHLDAPPRILVTCSHARRTPDCKRRASRAVRQRHVLRCVLRPAAPTTTSTQRCAVAAPPTRAPRARRSTQSTRPVPLQNPTPGS